MWRPETTTRASRIDIHATKFWLCSRLFGGPRYSRRLRTSLRTYWWCEQRSRGELLPIRETLVVSSQNLPSTWDLFCSPNMMLASVPVNVRYAMQMPKEELASTSISGGLSSTTSLNPIPVPWYASSWILQRRADKICSIIYPPTSRPQSTMDKETSK